MNSRTFLKWVSAWAAIVLAQGALLSANAAEVVYPAPGQTSVELDIQQILCVDLGKTYDSEVLLKVEFDGLATRAYNAYIYVSGYADGFVSSGAPNASTVKDANKQYLVSPNSCDGLDGTLTKLNTYQSYCRIYRISAGMRWFTFRTHDASKAKNFRVSIVSVSEAMAVYDETWDDVNSDDLLQTVLTTRGLPSNPFENLPNFKYALLNGTPFHVHFLGDSIISDTFTSSFETLIQSAYPNSQIEFTVEEDDNQGCWYYKDHFDESVPHGTDLLVIGGISNFRSDWRTTQVDVDALASVVEQATTEGMEILYLSSEKSIDSRGIDDFNCFWDGRDFVKWYTDCESGSWDGSKDVWASHVYFPEQRNAVLSGTIAQCWDVFPQYQEFVYQSGRPYGWFNRDSVHNNARGRELLSRVLFEYVKAGVPVPSGDSNEDYAASTNLVGVTWLKNPTNPANVTNLLVAVPWVATDGSEISLTNVIRTANLSEGDMIWICNAPDPTHKSLQYEAWRLNSSTNWEAISVVNRGTDEPTTSRDPATVTLKVGDAYRVVRKGTGKVYVCGRAPEAGAKVTHTFTGKGWHLFAPPQSGEKFQFVTDDINSWTWNGLEAGDQVLYQMASGNLNTLKYSNGSFSCKPSYKNMKSLVGSGMWFYNNDAKIVTVSFP